jgi:hypothetical protein
MTAFTSAATAIVINQYDPVISFCFRRPVIVGANPSLALTLLANRSDGVAWLVGRTDLDITLRNGTDAAVSQIEASADASRV